MYYVKIKCILNDNTAKTLAGKRKLNIIHHKLPLPTLTPLLLDVARVYVWTDGAAAGVGRLAGGLGTLKRGAVFQRDVVSEAAKIESVVQYIHWWKNI